ncbi:MAG: peptidoglycan synthetase [Bacteroidales bacterium]|nr:peptidoglycan synthetase [Bacteroidales bacterium]
MKAHFIAIGGSAMHNLAIALHLKGYQVTGSDDEIFDPARTRLQRYGLLPPTIGWDPARITPDLDAVVLGMHARKDNPELLRAQELGLKIYSYPEYLYEQSKDKTRVVIGGSHGKTTTTAMILHVLQRVGIDADYMVGAQLEGFEVMVKLSQGAKVMVIEGDEYLTSPIDPRPKFYLYRPNIAIMTGIEWDHINVFPTFEIYKEQFSKFVDLIEHDGTLIYCDDDKEVQSVARGNERRDITKLPYNVPAHHVDNEVTYLDTPEGTVPLKIFGRHNLLNLTAARMACNTLGISNEQFYNAIQSFKGASKRLELVEQTPQAAVYKDFAHAPSKLRATVSAMKEQYPSRRLVACMELHTFSSLTDAFLTQYAGTMDKADIAYVYFNPHAIEHKKLPPLSVDHVLRAFNNPNIKVYNDSKQLVNDLHTLFDTIRTENPELNTNLLLMSSGNFDGVDFNQLAHELLHQ